MKKIVTLAGDGIGPEIMAAGLEVLAAVAAKTGFAYETQAKAFGGAGIDASGHPLPKDTLDAAKSADAILLAAIGSPQYDSAPVRPEQGLLAIRKELNLFANIRPVRIFDALKHLSPLKPERIEGVDFVVVRELTGGIYFGEHTLNDDSARDINDYSADEIRRIMRKAFEIARGRSKKVTSIDKQNVLATSKLWRKVADEVAKEYPDVALEHQLVDSAAMIMITNPARFDVVVTENLFGDILSDESSVLPGTLGVMPSASHSENGPSLYEPIHGSAPDIAGQGIANPISMILSVAMMLRESFGENASAEMIEMAVDKTLTQGILTRDLGGSADTKQMTVAIIANL
ncbi:3-isopropylmalate dehydrogenase [Streptococcus ratti]|uniref:3-isopropylmalate dehydrogenase n=1 Tax=Streptococcus ratti FA-1 = DSM 20564 TaxID=699248 RepID=A0ABN0GVP8_STRRT|nr:3-isopropylmalate dehydrogenase [Streptococcus ratti]EJN94278.1 3-isopropylmalate dehydrogenase [Streptococcus ratti FA-1 = DSM 20564]EMP70895.1 3-isopropylmalate dehydrogenase [Streptococcus ratti FA-1 = DSM 20564]QEY06232.1 3-isopropylmalate dehydrogenase [Streptococcus ratti]VEI60572.1 3-isopropylmalate dehydrogenase [Streptococcus mutans]